jgi:hypothetical protein
MIMKFHGNPFNADFGHQERVMQAYLRAGEARNFSLRKPGTDKV